MLKSYQKTFVLSSQFDTVAGAGEKGSVELVSDVPNKKLPVIKEINVSVSMATGNAAPLASQTYGLDLIFAATEPASTISPLVMRLSDGILPGMVYQDAFVCNGATGVGHLFAPKRLYATVELPLPSADLHYGCFALGVIAGAHIFVEIIYELKKYTSDQYLQIVTSLYQ